MTVMVSDSRVMTMDELAAFLSSSEALTFRGETQREMYAWVEQMLRRYRYSTRPRAEKGLLRQYLGKMTGYSPAQLSRLIARYRRTGRVRLPAYRRHRFPVKFSREDQALLAEVDNAHDRLSGPATQAILRREYSLFGRTEFGRLSTISMAHLYQLRQAFVYRQRSLTVHKTRPTTVHISERRKPDPQGQPGYLRVDTVHQGDRDGQKGVYHINTIDETTGVGKPGVRGAAERAPPSTRSSCSRRRPSSSALPAGRQGRQGRQVLRSTGYSSMTAHLFMLVFG